MYTPKRPFWRAQVAEARARKKMRMAKKLDKVKKAATSIVDDTEMSDKSKARALERAYKKGMREEKSTKTLVVHRCGDLGSLGCRDGAALLRWIAVFHAVYAH